MNEQYLFNKVPISRKMQDTGNETVYAPGEMLFKYNGTEKEIILPEGIKTIENSAFANNYSVEYVKLPDSVEFIGPQAFWCSSIKNIDLSSNLIEIGDSAFRGSKLEKINLPPSVKYIRRGAFMECINLKSASLPEGLEEIGHNAFQWCYELKEINIPKSVKFLGKNVFEDCNALKKFTCYENFTIDVDSFGKNFPRGLVNFLEGNMTAAAYQKYVLTDKVWSKLDRETQLKFFIKRNTKGTLSGYSNCIKVDDVTGFGKLLIEKATENETKDMSRALFNFIFLFYDFSDRDLFLKMVDILKNRSNAEKLIGELEQSENIMKAINANHSESSKTENGSINTFMFNDFDDIDSIPDCFYTDMGNLDLSNPVSFKMKKTIVSSGNLKFTVKFQSDKAMNNDLVRYVSNVYDPLDVIRNELYEEKSIILPIYPAGEAEHKFIKVKSSTSNILSETLTKRFKFFIRTIKLLQNEDILKYLVEKLPKKKNGTFHIKKTVEISPLMVMGSSFSFLVLCIKSTKDNEAEVSIKEYNFTQINQVHEFLEKMESQARELQLIEL